MFLSRIHLVRKISISDVIYSNGLGIYGIDENSNSRKKTSKFVYYEQRLKVYLKE